MMKSTKVQTLSALCMTGTANNQECESLSIRPHPIFEWGKFNMVHFYLLALFDGNTHTNKYFKGNVAV